MNARTPLLIATVTCLTLHSATAVVSIEPDQVDRTFQQGSDGYRGAFDTQLFLAQPDTDLSASPVILVDLGSETSQALLRFDDIIGERPDQVPAGARIVSATLTITPVSGGAEGAVAYCMAAYWYGPDTWNLWIDGVQPDGLEAYRLPMAPVGPVGANPVDIDVTASLQMWCEGGTNRGWVITHEGPSFDGFEFASSDHPDASARPRLTVAFELPCPSDVTQDGLVDVDDLISVILSWGSCP